MKPDDSDFSVASDGDTSPVITKVIQPWKYDHISPEDIIRDLMGCILKHWSYYRDKFNAPYSQAEAISDAYHDGILKAIERDKYAPTCAGSKIKCKHCEKVFEAPKELPGDARANKIYAEFPPNRVPIKRSITLSCTECGQENKKVIYKSVFSTCVFPYIRSAIQRGVISACTKKNTMSLNGFTDNDNSLLNVISVLPEEESHGLPTEVLSILDNVINDLPERQRYVLAMHHGIGGIYKELVEREITCHHCAHDAKASVDNKKAEPFTAVVDYSMSRNSATCPCCRKDIDIDMKMSQTDIAKHLDVSKQRICSTLKTIMGHLQNDDRLSNAMRNFEII